MANSITVVGMAELVANAQQQLDVLKQMLQAATQKQPALEALPLERASFSDTSQLFNRLMHAV